MTSGEFSRSFEQLGRLYGLGELEVVIKKEAETSCRMTDNGMVIVCNSEDLRIDDNIPQEAAALYIIARELARAFETVQNPRIARMYRKKRGSEKIFYDFIDYTAIDYANRRIPLLDKYMDIIYEAIMPDNPDDFAMYISLLYAIRMSHVMKKKPKMRVTNKVLSMLDDLRNYRSGGAGFDVLSVLGDPKTSMTERRQIADIFIKPRYRELRKALQPASSENDSEGNTDENGEDGEDAQGTEDGETSPEQEGGENQGTGGADDEADQERDGKEGISDFSADKTTALGDMLRERFVEALDSQERKNGLRAVPDKKNAAEQRAGNAGGTDNSDTLAPIAGFLSESLALDQDGARDYALSLEKWRPMIRRMAEVFLKLACPAEILLSPRYDHSAKSEGYRLHPRRICEAAVQQKTRARLGIWQPLKRRGRRQSLSFGGLDVYLLADVSGSMEGEKARCAADAALCIIEGLQLAAYLARGKNRLRRPDIRIELAAFGAGYELMCPLSYEQAGSQKGKMFLSLRNAHSKGTCISAALNRVTDSAKREKRRAKLVFIVSDGRFHDAEEAELTARTLRGCAGVKQVFIHETGTVISDSWETIASPFELPEKLFELLKEEIEPVRTE